MSPALIFDLDGTLVDTAPDLLGALNAILIAEGRPPVDHADLRHLVGFGARTMMAEAFKMTGAAMDADRLPALIDSYHRALSNAHRGREPPLRRRRGNARSA